MRSLFSMILIGLAAGAPEETRVPEPSSALAGLDVLIVSPKNEPEGSVWIARLLERYGARTARVSWDGVSAGRARKCDLVVVTGRPRRITRPVPLDLGRPVLGLGAHGLAYFGRMNLKHGAPFS